MRARAWLGLWLWLGLAGLAAGQMKRTNAVRTAWGGIRGFVVQPPVPSLRPVDVYLGVPYGQPPTGDRRFMPPQTKSKWTGKVKEALRRGPSCPQTAAPNLQRRAQALQKMPPLRYDFLKRLLPKMEEQSEDCLYLNLYVPQRQGPEPRVLLGVLVLVGGESYEWAGGSSAYNASVLASYSQLVVVTLDYRQGVLGFLSSADAACRGNYGLSDVVCALDFLRGILRPFGGDPDAITLAGWGSGAALVNLLMSSPVSNPHTGRLFKRAVLLGGSSLAPEAVVKNPAESFYRLAEKLQCPTTTGKANKKVRPMTEVLGCVRGHSLKNLTVASEALERASFTTVFGPVIDGMIVINPPLFNLRKHANLYHQVDLLVGLTSSPGYSRLSSEDMETGLDVAKAQRIYRTIARNLYSFHRREIFSAIANQYRDWTSPSQHPISVRDGVISALSDALVTAPAVEAAQLHAAQGPGTPKSSTFLYVFAYATQEWEHGTVQGAVTREDLPYILGYPLLHPTSMGDLAFQASFSRQERLISEAMMRYLSNFVKSGDPNRPIPIRSPGLKNKRFEDLRWPPFQEQKQAYALIDERPRGDGVFYKAEEVGFWNSFLRSLEAAGEAVESADGDAHNLLPNHFKADSYFGVTRPYGGYADLPFPPPPLPPTPMPKELTTMLQDEKKQAKPTTPGSSSGETPGVVPAGPMEYSTILSVTVAVGCALLVLNILIFAGIYHQRDKQKRSKKQLQLHYQSYDTNTGAGGPRMPPAPPPPITAAMASPNPHHGSRDGFHLDGESLRTFHSHHAHHALSHGTPGGPRDHSAQGRGGFQEAEPLLSSSQASLGRGGGGGGGGGGSVGHGISPTCPRHGRALAAAHANAHSSQGPHGLEEIQV